jgi:hypothetical protein
LPEGLLLLTEFLTDARFALTFCLALIYHPYFVSGHVDIWANGAGKACCRDIMMTTFPWVGDAASSLGCA